MGSGSRPIVAATDYLGVSAPTQGVQLSNPINPAFRLPTAPVSDETPLHRLFASDRKVQELEKDVSATRLAISSLCDRGFQPPQLLLDSASSLSRELVDAKRSSSELRGEIRPPPSQPGVSSHLQRFATATPVQPGSSHPEGDPASAGPSRRRSYDSPSGSFGRSSRQGSDTPPHKRRRLSDDSSADEGESSSSRRQRDDEQADEENFRPASLALLLDYIMKKFPAASKPLAQPSSRRFHVFETAGLVDESSPRSSNLAWFDHMRLACESAQSKFESRIFEGRSLSTLMPSVSRTEKVSDSPCQGKGLKVNSQVYDLMSSRPSDFRSVPLSVREATVLETTLRSTMESYNFQLWTMTALFRFLGESGHFNLDDPLLDQFQRSFSRGMENVAAGMASAVAFVTTRGGNPFSVTWYRLSRRPRSANCCRILSSNRKISLRLPPSRRLVMWREMSPCIGEPSLGLPRHLGRLSGGLSLRLLRPEVVLTHLLSLHRSAPQHHLLRSVFRLRRSRPIPRRSGCLGHFWPAWGARGVDAWVVEVLREGYRILFSRRPPLSDQPLPMPSYTPSSIRGKALEQEFQDLLHKQAIEQAPQTPGFYSRLFVVQKDSGAWHPIIDLSTLNTYIASQRFHMETPQSVLRSIRQGY